MNISGKLSVIYSLVMSLIKVTWNRWVMLRWSYNHGWVVIFLLIWSKRHEVFVLLILEDGAIIMMIPFMLLKWFIMIFLYTTRVVGAPLFEYLLSRRWICLHCWLLLNLILIFFLVSINYLINHLDPILEILWFIQNTCLRLFLLVMIGGTLTSMSIWKLFLYKSLRFCYSCILTT